MGFYWGNKNFWVHGCFGMPGKIWTEKNNFITNENPGESGLIKLFFVGFFVA